MQMANASTPAVRPAVSMLNLRWFQLLIGILGMVAIANLQYGWTLFVDPINEKFKFGRVGIQFAFTIFVFCETWLVPIEGYLVDRFGPRWIVAIGGMLVGLGWMINASADTLGLLYLGAIVGGAGAGIVYGTSVGNALKWFPDRRGLAAGLTAAAFGAGSAATVVPISNMILTQGYQAAFFTFGIGQGIIVVLCALLMRAPAPDDVPAVTTGYVRQGGRDFTWREMLQTPAFWLLYVMMTMLATGGIMATAQLAPMAKDFKVANVPVSIFGVTLIAVQLALQLDRILNGLTRPFFGWVSDHIGRENTMFIAFTLEGIAIFFLLTFAANPLWFAIFSGLTFFAWGEIYSLFPALCGDLFGRKYATVNYGLLYTAKGTATLLVPLGSYLYNITQSWWPIFGLAIAFDWTGALLALLILKPLHRRWLAL
jgi:MFS transporter, OFA family, oxalate/formate antiporter